MPLSYPQHTGSEPPLLYMRLLSLPNQKVPIEGQQSREREKKHDNNYNNKSIFIIEFVVKKTAKLITSI